jgi:hypothetical protein
MDSINADDLKRFASALQRQKCLETLRLGAALMHSPCLGFAPTLAVGLQANAFSKLVELRLNFHDRDSTNLPIIEALRMNRTIKTLHIELGDRLIEPFVDMMRVNDTLEEIAVGVSPAVYAQVSSLLDALCKNRSVRRFCVASFRFDQSGVDALIRLLSNNKTLQLIDFRGMVPCDGETEEVVEHFMRSHPDRKFPMVLWMQKITDLIRIQTFEELRRPNEIPGI